MGRTCVENARPEVQKHLNAAFIGRRSQGRLGNRWEYAVSMDLNQLLRFRNLRLMAGRRDDYRVHKGVWVVAQY